MVTTAGRRLHGRLLPIVQTAAAAVAAWLLAGLLVADSRPAFAAIAAVVCVGATYGQRGELAAAYDDPRHAGDARRLALDAAATATEIHGERPELTLTELVGQVRSTAVDVVRAADLVADAPEPAVEQATEELLVVSAS